MEQKRLQIQVFLNLLYYYCLGGATKTLKWNLQQEAWDERTIKTFGDDSGSCSGSEGEQSSQTCKKWHSK